MDTSRDIEEARFTKEIPEVIAISSGDHVSSVEQRRARGALVARSLGRDPDGSIPVFGNGEDRVDARLKPKIRH